MPPPLDGEVNSRNTIIAGNFDTPNNAGSGAIHPDVSGKINGDGNNLLGDSRGAEGTIGTITDLVNVDPLLGPLAFNGGPTKTHALLVGSPAIDAGDNSFVVGDTDQRGPGFDRIVGGIVDIGAYEVQEQGNLNSTNYKAQEAVSINILTDSSASTPNPSATYDLITGTANNDSLVGTPDRDLIKGSDGHDSLSGYEGDDRLDGGAGSDQLTGGAGADEFVLRLGEGADTIVDYEDGQDSFLLDGGLSFGQLQITQSNGDTFIEITSSGELLASLIGVQAHQIGMEDFATLV